MHERFAALLLNILRTSIVAGISILIFEHFCRLPRKSVNILGGFSYGYICTQLLGGILAERYGGKWVIGFGTFLSTAAE